MYDLFGARPAFGAMAALPLLSLVIITTRYQLLSIGRGASKEPPGRLRTIDLMRLQSLRRWLIANGVFAAAITLIPLIMPLHAANVGLSASVTSGIIAAVALGTITMRSFVAVLLARFRSDILLGGALIFAALTYSMLPFFHDWRWLAGVSLGLGMSLGLGQPISMSLIYSEAPHGRVNESLGLALSLASFQQMLAPLTLGIVASTFGIAPMVWMVAVTLAACALYTVSGRERQKP
jgi:predicted MFS family arabinose efflux permease